MNSFGADKVALRRAVLAGRDALPAAERAGLGWRITASLLCQPVVRNARCVLAYLSFGSEFDTAEFIQALSRQGATLVLPRIERDRRALTLHAVADLSNDLAPGVWGIREPRPESCPRVQRESLDLVLAPGVAFTPRGDRLGYGGGFYDRLLGEWPQRPPVLAAAFEIQIVDHLPVADHDIPVDCVVTETREMQRS